jgi:methylthioribose-1-phosphate isomerase
MHIKHLAWTPAGTLLILDQTLLPAEERWLEIRTLEALLEALRSLRVRGAPAIGIAAAMGLVAVVRVQAKGAPRAAALALVEAAAAAIVLARPTGVNLHWAMERMRRRAAGTPGDGDALLAALRAEADAIWAEDQAMCAAIAEHGQLLMRQGIRVLTHCNTGALATGGIGTALGIVLRAAERGLDPEVWVDETRPLMQGARLTAWELLRAGVRHAVLPDAAAAALLSQGKVDMVLVGADRIARNGDVANKIGTLGVAVLARHYGVPFYSVAPTSSFDPACPDGALIAIEHRGADEVAAPFGIRVAPEGSPVFNPAFDVTPAALVTGYVTERGILHPPFEA